MQVKLTIEVWWIVLALIPIIFCWVWLVELPWGAILGY